jgi:hypothetical protein
MLTDSYLSRFLDPWTTVAAPATSSIEPCWRAAYWLNTRLTLREIVPNYGEVEH